MRESAPVAASAATADGDSATPRKKKKKVHGSSAKGGFKGELSVTVVKARGLKAADDDGTSDPYCEVSIRDAKKNEALEEKTHRKKDTLEPEWNETFTL